MSLLKKLTLQRRRRTLRVRGRQLSRREKLRISVFRSLDHIYAQIIDDVAHATIASFSSRNLKDMSVSKKDQAKQVGLELGKLAAAKNVQDVFLDRGKYRYHGRVQALADGLRESGLKL